MICPKCGGKNVSIQLEQLSAKTNKHGNGIGGIANNIARSFVAICTLGLSNLFWKKSVGNETTKIKTKKVCLCQDCGNSWDME